MKKKGKLYYADKDIISPLDGEFLSVYRAFFYAKIGKDMYLIITDNIFRKDPIRRFYSIISEKKFRSLCKEHKLQESI